MGYTINDITSDNLRKYLTELFKETNIFFKTGESERVVNFIFSEPALVVLAKRMMLLNQKIAEFRERKEKVKESDMINIITQVNKNFNAFLKEVFNPNRKESVPELVLSKLQKAMIDTESKSGEYGRLSKHTDLISKLSLSFSSSVPDSKTKIDEFNDTLKQMPLSFGDAVSPSQEIEQFARYLLSHDDARSLLPSEVQLKFPKVAPLIIKSSSKKKEESDIDNGKKLEKLILRFPELERLVHFVNTCNFKDITFSENYQGRALKAFLFKEIVEHLDKEQVKDLPLDKEQVTDLPFPTLKQMLQKYFIQREFLYAFNKSMVHDTDWERFKKITGSEEAKKGDKILKYFNNVSEKIAELVLLREKYVKSNPNNQRVKTLDDLITEYRTALRKMITSRWDKDGNLKTTGRSIDDMRVFCNSISAVKQIRVSPNELKQLTTEEQTLLKPVPAIKLDDKAWSNKKELDLWKLYEKSDEDLVAEYEHIEDAHIKNKF
jgi:hypothetical protein